MTVSQHQTSSTMSEFPGFDTELNFPAFRRLPREYAWDPTYYSQSGVPKTRWCFLAEIKRNVPWFRPTQYEVVDKHGGEYLVAFHPKDRAREPVIAAKCQNGYTMCIMYAVKHLFLDGQIGVRVDNESTVTILPCSLAEVRSIGDKMSNNNGRCNVCGASATLKCARCKLFYCNKSCQLKDWKGTHKTECKVVQQIVKWEALDWNTVEEANLVEV
ncbi:hypothetical protein C8R47DRAFT_1135252 [Mycena vitilis]|nr:hypothetical protein C8R47DRAFT_1135252 [Mycena vitilis]